MLHLLMMCDSDLCVSILLIKFIHFAMATYEQNMDIKLSIHYKPDLVQVRLKYPTLQIPHDQIFPTEYMCSY